MCWFKRKKRLEEKSLANRRVQTSPEEVEEDEFLLVDYTVAESSEDESGIFFQ